MDRLREFALARIRLASLSGCAPSCLPKHCRNQPPACELCRAQRTCPAYAIRDSMHAMIVRHAKAPLIFTIYAAAVLGQEGQPAPWSKGELMPASSLAQLIKSSTTPATIISVVYPVLYRQRHILHARFAGPGNKDEGIEAL